MEQVKLPFRADIVGSFLRPERLKKARKDFESGLLSPAALQQIEDEEIEKLIDLYIAPISEKIDTLILGCTHYSIIKDIISKKYPKLKLIDPSIEVSIELGNYISNKNENGNIEYIVSGDIEKFKNNLECIFGKDEYFVSKDEGK
mgnify:CR=1 FL=1